MKRLFGLWVVGALLLSLACGSRSVTDPDGQQDGKGLPEIPRTPAQDRWPSSLLPRLQIPDSALPKGIEIAEAGSIHMVMSLELPGEVVGDESRPGRSVPSERNRVAEVGSGPVFILVHVPVRDLADVRVGQKAQIEARTLGREVPGQVASIGTMDGQPTRSAPVSILIPDPGGRWWPGLDVRVKIEKESFVAAVGISRSALQILDGQSVVFVRSGDWFEVRPVTVGRTDDDVVEINQGLTPGERYAATNSDLVRAVLRRGASSPQP